MVLPISHVILWIQPCKPLHPERQLGIAMGFENENDNLLFGLAFADGEFRYCPAATTR